MTLIPRLRSSARIGIALSSDRLTAVQVCRDRKRGDQRLWSRPLDPAVDRSPWADLGCALAELPEMTGISRARVAIALLPPLVELKRLELPPIRAVQLERVLVRDASGYFLRAKAPQLVGLERRSAVRGRAVPTLAAAADASLVEQLYKTVAHVGWSLERIVPAYPAWIELCRRAGLARRPGWAAVVSLPRSVELLLPASGAPMALRRLPPEPDPARLVGRLADLLGDPAGAPRSVLLLGGGDARDALGEALAGRGFQIVPMTREFSAWSDDPEAAAAAGAWNAAGPELVPEREVARHQHRVATIARASAAAAALLLAAAGGLARWDLERELAHVRERRDALHADVTDAMAVRGALDSLDDRVRALEAAERRRTPWSAAIASLTAAIPADAYLVAWHAQPDSLRLEGSAPRAAAVFTAVQRAEGIAGVRADAPIRQELRDSEPPVEHFVLAARLAPAGSTGAPR